LLPRPERKHNQGSDLLVAALEDEGVDRTFALVPTLEVCFAAGGVHLVAVPFDYSENVRGLVDRLGDRTLSAADAVVSNLACATQHLRRPINVGKMTNRLIETSSPVSDLLDRNPAAKSRSEVVFPTLLLRGYAAERLGRLLFPTLFVLRLFGPTLKCLICRGAMFPTLLACHMLPEFPRSCSDSSAAH
jgi:hypothetical protein